MKIFIIISFFIIMACSSAQKNTETRLLKQSNNNKGIIAGCVYQGSEPINQVEITIKDVNTAKDKHTALSSDNGFFLLTETAPDAYDLIAVKDGYKKLLIKSIPVKAGKVSFVKVRLRNEYTEIMQRPLHWEDAGVEFISFDEFDKKDNWCK